MVVVTVVISVVVVVFVAGVFLEFNGVCLVFVKRIAWFFFHITFICVVAVVVSPFFVVASKPLHN